MIRSFDELKKHMVSCGNFEGEFMNNPHEKFINSLMMAIRHNDLNKIETFDLLMLMPVNAFHILSFSGTNLGSFIIGRNSHELNFNHEQIYALLSKIDLNEGYFTSYAKSEASLSMKVAEYNKIQNLGLTTPQLVNLFSKCFLNIVSSTENTLGDYITMFNELDLNFSLDDFMELYKAQKTSKISMEQSAGAFYIINPHRTSLTLEEVDRKIHLLKNEILVKSILKNMDFLSDTEFESVNSLFEKLKGKEGISKEKKKKSTFKIL